MNLEPNSASAWIGVAGVVVGGLLTLGVRWIEIVLRERRGKRAETINAADDLRNGATALMVIADSYGSTDNKRSNPIEWTGPVIAQFDRMEKAAETIRRNTTPELARLGSDVGTAAFAYWNEPTDRGIVNNAILDFSAAMKAAGY